jgi:hypothetical protein
LSESLILGLQDFTDFFMLKHQSFKGHAFTPEIDQ